MATGHDRVVPSLGTAIRVYEPTDELDRKPLVSVDYIGGGGGVLQNLLVACLQQLGFVQVTLGRPLVQMAGDQGLGLMPPHLSEALARP